ncbi:hypothetical protein [Actinomycetospora aeridis]|uniref:Uncharacterized protein n=1 Tax=Actinomycetospora aeridis TaxID=3129231 RepID=A0ABU8N188_9PSEU
MSRPVVPSQSGTSAVAGSDVVANGGEALQVHDLPSLLDAGAQHAQGEAYVLAAAWERSKNADGADTRISEALFRAMQAMMAAVQCLQRAAQHSTYLASITPDYRGNGDSGASVVAIQSQLNTGSAYALGVGSSVVVSAQRLQIHDVPPLLEAATLHIRGESEALLRATDTMRNAEGIDNNISRELALATTYVLSAEHALQEGKQAAEEIAAVAPNFRDGGQAALGGRR